MPQAAAARLSPDDEYEPYTPVTLAERRTVRITGHPTPPRRRESATRSQLRARPDRLVMWAFLLGLFLVFMAVATASAQSL
ncbi:MAG: hypothetical protein ACR2HC_05610 [Thermoleophilaceae bacterium]